MNFLKSKTYLEDLVGITSDAGLQNQLYMKKVLITGANGLIASVLTDALTLFGNIDVFALCRSREQAQARFGNRVNLMVQDVSEPLNTDINFDYIIHAASNAHPLAYAQSPVDTMKSNIIGTINVLEYARIHNTKRILFVSSSEIYGIGSESGNNQLSKNYYGYIDLADPRSSYPESKRAAEVLCSSYRHQFNLNTVCVRPWYVYGPTFTESSSKADAQFLRKAFAGEDIVMKSPGVQLRSYCYVSDCVSAMLGILLNGKNNAYDIAGKDNVSIRKFAETIAELANVGITVQEPSHIEYSGYTKVPNSICYEQKTRELVLPRYTVKEGIARTLQIMHELA